MLSLPALITLALPDTGAASIRVPDWASDTRNSAEPSTEIEECSTRMRGPLRSGKVPWPEQHFLQVVVVATMVNTMSQSARSES